MRDNRGALLVEQKCVCLLQPGGRCQTGRLPWGQLV